MRLRVASLDKRKATEVSMTRNTRTPLHDRLRCQVSLLLPDFRTALDSGDVRQLHFREREPAEWYREFADRLREASSYLPIYRMSDGEFVFACGVLPMTLRQFGKNPATAMKSWIKHLLGWRKGTFLSGTPGYGYETYNTEEWEAAKKKYGERVSAIARRGILALNLVHQGGFALQYTKPFCDWLDAAQVELDDGNCYPFYFIYALFLGPAATDLLAGKRILVVTSDDDGLKMPGIRRSLLALGAISAELIKISRTQSLLDRITIPAPGSVDMVLIAAGVGSINILEQLEPLNVPSIDVGFVLDCYADPGHYMGRRAFTLPDGGHRTLGIAAS
jgi:hypothetical protein